MNSKVDRTNSLLAISVKIKTQKLFEQINKKPQYLQTLQPHHSTQRPASRVKKGEYQYNKEEKKKIKPLPRQILFRRHNDRDRHSKAPEWSRGKSPAFIARARHPPLYDVDPICQVAVTNEDKRPRRSLSIFPDVGFYENGRVEEEEEADLPAWSLRSADHCGAINEQITVKIPSLSPRFFSTTKMLFLVLHRRW